MTNVQLRDYQQDLIDRIYRSWQSGNRNVFSVMPTGAGKSVVVSELVMHGVQSGMTQAIIAHRNELVTQMSMHIANRGIPHRIIGSDATVRQATNQHYDELKRSFVHPSARTAVIGVGTLISRADKVAEWCKQVDRWYIDEAHHTLVKNQWGKAAMMFPNAHGLGVTATPVRADGNGLGRDYDGLADDLIVGPSMGWLIQNNFLADYEIVCPASDLNVDDDKRSASGDWSSQYLKKSAKKSHIVGDVVENYIKYANDRKAICFATDVETSADIAARFNESGIKAASLCAKSQPAVRDKYLNEFKNGQVKVLVNVDLFDEGFDVPDCEVCIMARPTASLGKYRQQIGRALRYMEGKVALIIDHVSNVKRHGLPDRHINWTLARRDKRASKRKDPDDIDLTVCVSCTRPYEAFRTACPHCGHEKPLPEPRSRSVEMVQGDLILLDRETLERMRVMTVPESPADIADRVSAAAGPIAGKAAANRQIEKIEQHEKLHATIEQWAGIQRHKGYNDREIARQFYLTLGVDVLTALNAKQTGKEMDKLRETIEGWYDHE